MTNNFKVGLVALIIASFAGAFVFWQNNIVQQFSGYDVKVRFDNIGSLIIGAEIRYRGFKVGRVTEISPKPTHVDVVFWVHGDLKITKGSTFKILFDGLVGENYLSIVPNSNTAQEVPRGQLQYGTAGSDLANFIDIGAESMVHVKVILAELKEIFVGTDLLKNIDSLVSNSQKISDNLMGMTNHSNQKNIERILSDVALITGELSAVISTQNSTVVSEKLLDAGQKIDQIIDDLAIAVDSFKMLVSTSNRGAVSEILENVSQSSSQIKQSFDISLKTNTGVFYDSKNELGYMSTDLHVKKGQFSLISGLTNRGGDTKFRQFQQGYDVYKGVRSRIGVYENSAGVGLDLFPVDRFKFSIDFYKFEDAYISLGSKYNLWKHFYIHSRLYFEKENSVSTGIDYYF